MRDGCVPDAHAVTVAAQLRPYDVEAEEGEAGVIVDAGDGRRRLAAELPDQKTLRVHGGEARGVRAAGIPAFRRRPIGGKRDLVRTHRANTKIILWRLLVRHDPFLRPMRARGDMLVATASN